MYKHTCKLTSAVCVSYFRKYEHHELNVAEGSSQPKPVHLSEQFDTGCNGNSLLAGMTPLKLPCLEKSPIIVWFRTYKRPGRNKS